MLESYEEIVNGESLLRPPPDQRHELVCQRLHTIMATSIRNVATTRLLAPRSVVQVATGTMVRPDLALTTSANGRLWLAAEIIEAKDHRIDTVLKKGIYEDLNLPRLWMVDTRYDNVEVYHCSSYGLTLKGILACREVLRETLLPAFEITIHRLFET